MEEKLERLLTAFKTNLATAIKGREDSDEDIDPKATSGRSAFIKRNLPITINGERIESRFTVHADCKCSAASEFIRRATTTNLSIVEGKKKGKRIGIDGEPVMNLNIFWPP